ncbi:MAG TPA: cation:proton antiporter [Kofleriaceae bacterium]|nr:cation:proton antiporter [Kofleriaceae bacterium]
MIPVLVLLALGGLMAAARSFAGGAHAGGTELAFGFLLLAAYFNAKLVTRIGLPRLTGYLAAGIVVGPHVLGLVSKPMTAQLGLVGATASAMIALNAGAELNLKAVRPLLGVVFRITGWTMLGTFVGLTAALLALRPLVPFLDSLPATAAIATAMSVAIALSAHSPAVVMALINETGAEGVLTRTVLAAVVLGDLVVIIAFGVATSIARAVVSGQLDVGGAAGGLAWSVLGSIGVGIFVGMVLGLFIHHVGRGTGPFTVMLCLMMGELGVALGLDPLILALAAGLWLENGSRANARALLDGFEAASLPVYLVFFALAGVKLHLAALAALAAPVAVLIAVRALAFFAGSRLGTRGPGVEPAVRRLAWLGLLPQAGVALALADLIRTAFPDFGNDAFALVLGVVATNELLAPVALRLALLRSGEAGKRAPAAGPH